MHGPFDYRCFDIRFGVYLAEFEMADVWASRIPARLPTPDGPLPDGFGSVESIRQLVAAHPVRNVGAALRASRRVVELVPAGSEWPRSTSQSP